MKQPKQGVAYRYNGDEAQMTAGKIYVIEEVVSAGIYVRDDNNQKHDFWPSEYENFDEVDWDLASDAELVSENKRKYPPGTKFRNACNPLLIETVPKDPIYLPDGSGINGYGWTFYDGKWAEIIEEPIMLDSSANIKYHALPQEPKAGDMVEGSDNKEFWSTESGFYVGPDVTGRHVVQINGKYTPYLYIRLPEVDEAQQNIVKELMRRFFASKDATIDLIKEAIEWGRNNPKTK